MSVASTADALEGGAGAVKSRPVLSAYSTRLRALRNDLTAAQSMRKRALVSAAVCIGLAVIFVWLALLHPSLPLLYSLVPLAGVLLSSRRYIQAGAQWRELERRCAYLDRGIRRIEGRWQGEGKTGEEFARDKHLYQSDLNVFGEGSLFELLCTARSVLGAERLASYLLDSVELNESKLRQEAVAELRDAARLREEMDLLGDFRSQDCRYDAFEGWLSLPPIIVPAALRYLLLLSSSSSLLIGVGILGKALLWSAWLPVILVLIVIQTGVAGLLLRRVRPRLQQVRLLTNAFTVLHQGLQLIERQHFTSLKLRGIVERVSSQKASVHLRSLERLTRLFDQREKPLFELPSKLLAVGTQLVLAVDAWRERHQQHLREWMDAWAEFEALQAMAGYAFEQNGCVFPELVDGDPVFEAAQLGHPLLGGKLCVRNDIVLDDRSRFYLISGSNMAGKSTLLRTIGLNAVIAFAGGPVRASQARLSCLVVCASLAITDSLLEGKSKFLAEVERLSETISLSRSGEPVLFLIDEILSGTNSRDRKSAAEISQNSNALAIVRMMGIPICKSVGAPYTFRFASGLLEAWRIPFRSRSARPRQVRFHHFAGHKVLSCGHSRGWPFAAQSQAVLRS